MRLNGRKTKLLIVSKDLNKVINIQIYKTQFEKVLIITFDGSQLNEMWNQSIEIRSQIEKVECDMELNIELGIRFLKCYVFQMTILEAFGDTDELWEFQGSTTQ